MNTLYLSIRVFIILLAMLYLNACKDRFDETSDPHPSSVAGVDSTSIHTPLEAYPGQTGILKTGELFGQPITYEEINGEAVFQGDIILSPEQLSSGGDSTGSANSRTSGAGVADKQYRWLHYTIPYTIASDLPNKARVTNAIAHWEARTPLRFVLRTNEPDYITFKPSTGCSSEYGRKGGQQYIKLASGCDMGAVIHEIGHAVGLFHEQSRVDRDKFITIHDENIEDGKEKNFYTYSQLGKNGFDFRTFDLGSIMMYDPYAFSKNGKPTITRKDGSLYTVNEDVLSQNDIATVVSMYANLYIIKGGKMYAVALSEGWGMELSGGWDGFNAKTMAEDQNDQYLWTINGDILWRVNRLTGKAKSFGSGWNGAVGITGIPNNTTRWAIKGKDLYAINQDGLCKDVDGFDWSNSKAIYAHKDYLFIVDGNGTLWKSDMNTGKWHNMGGGWGATKAIMTTRASDNLYIYMITGTTLWRVNYNTGASTKIGPSYWGGAEGMVGYQGNLYIIADGTLWKVSENGNRQAIIGGWSGIQSMGIIRNPGLN